MRPRGPAIALIALAACGGDGPSGPDPNGRTGPEGWAPVAAAPLSTGAGRHDDIFFLDRARGWIVNGLGEVHRTEDAGESWSLVSVEPRRYNRAVGFATPSRGWLGNLNGFNDPEPSNALFETVDGGATWTNITNRIAGDEPVGICGIHVLDEQTVFAVGRWSGPAVFVRSFDGGATWQGTNLAPLATGLIDVHFFDRAEGIIVGGLGVGNSPEAQQSSRTVILGTRDGGATWETRYISQQQGKWAWKISFPSRDTGWVSTQGPTADGVVLRTVDGGLTWSEHVAAPGHGFSGIGFITGRTGWVAADTTAFGTTDGGATWQRVPIGPNVNRFRILSSDLAYAAGRGVYRYRRPDG